MKVLTLGLAFLAGATSGAYGADSGQPKDYRAQIQDYVTLNVRMKHPEYGRLFFDFSVPGRALFGDKRQQRLAVHCDYGAALKNGDILLMTVRETFLIDEGFIYEVSSSDKFEWLDGAPKMDRNQPNQSSDPTLTSGTSPAGQEPRHP